MTVEQLRKMCRNWVASEASRHKWKSVKTATLNSEIDSLCDELARSNAVVKAIEKYKMRIIPPCPTIPEWNAEVPNSFGGGFTESRMTLSEAVETAAVAAKGKE